MNIVFMGTPDFAVSSLKALLAGPHRVLGVVTQPDRPKGRGRSLRPPAVKAVALAHGLSLAQPERLTDPGFLQTLCGWSPELIAVVSFGILPPEVLTLPPKGVVNVHASLLPRYRGAAPINWAIMRGESETGVTTFLIEPAVDCGDILLQRPVRIGPDETAGELHDRLKEVGARLLVETVEGIAEGTLHARPQPRGGASTAPKLTKEDARIPWDKDAAFLRNLIRGTNPWPGAFTTCHGHLLKVHRAALAQNAVDARSGEILVADAKLGVQVASGQGALWLTEVQPGGKRAMHAAEWVRGYDIRPGDRLGP